MISITAAPEAPAPRIRILDARQREVETVRIGDRLTFRIEIPEDSKAFYSIMATHNTGAAFASIVTNKCQSMSFCTNIKHCRRNYGLSIEILVQEYHTAQCFDRFCTYFLFSFVLNLNPILKMMSFQLHTASSHAAVSLWPRIRRPQSILPMSMGS